ncbi:hypothetical protein [Xenorhabdus sp. PB61.4]|uniref:hypothetical protein n=1 Tax=Xenorhabdus sp. PB61.4 TaxID=2788940 RepID=UPI0030D6FB80
MSIVAGIISYLFWGYIAVFGLIFGYISFPIGLLFAFKAFKRKSRKIFYSILAVIFLIPPIAALIIIKHIYP